MSEYDSTEKITTIAFAFVGNANPTSSYMLFSSASCVERETRWDQALSYSSLKFRKDTKQKLHDHKMRVLFIASFDNANCISLHD